ncbi:expressed unknown protein [Seminavis robusta]|uniref:Transmembrane protein n=1 Tax=Seminavis robusta TaxID=568900 RepID=A0A9N8DKL2_9STRA|nr:expressed unknown protein [Seminavis robusta]|eukprot:Sro210_g087580.1 n/a (215) ;mRNA; r:25042-25791
MPRRIQDSSSPDISNNDDKYESLCVIGLPPSLVDLPTQDDDSTQQPSEATSNVHSYSHRHSQTLPSSNSKGSNKSTSNRTSNTASTSNRSPDSRDLESGHEEYSFHFGATMIDQGKSGRDPTVRLLMFGAACIVLVLVVVAVALQPWNAFTATSDDPAPISSFVDTATVLEEFTTVSPTTIALPSSTIADESDNVDMAPLLLEPEELPEKQSNP